MSDKKMPEEVSPDENGTGAREACKKFWIAAYTRPRCEKKAASELTASGIEVYLPIQKQLRIWSDRKKYVDIPVIPMIIFAHINKTGITEIKKHHLIISLIRYPGKTEPAKITAEEIQRLKNMTGQTEIPVSFESGTLNTNDNAMVIKGTLRGLQGKIKQMKDDLTTVWVSVGLMGGAIIRIKTTDIQRI